MKRIKVYLTIGYPSADHRDTLEVDDDATPEEIEREVCDWASSYIDYGISDEGDD